MNNCSNIHVINEIAYNLEGLHEKKELILDGLSCANCAVKIEEKVKKIEGINDVNVNFVTQTMKFNVDDESKLKEIEK